MKPRRVFVTLELKTDARLDILRNVPDWQLMFDEVPISDGYTEVVQVLADVVKPKAAVK